MNSAMKTYAAVLATRKVGDLVALDPGDLHESPLCFCSRDTSYRSSQVAEVEFVETFVDERLEDVGEYVQRQRLCMVRATRIRVRILAVEKHAP